MPTTALNSLMMFGLIVLPFCGISQFTIDVPDAQETYVTGINNSDHIVGYFVNEVGTTNAFYQFDGEIVTFSIDNLSTWFGGINNDDMIVGRYNPSGATSDNHVFIYNPYEDTYTVIEDLDGYDFTSVNDINDNLQIAGDFKNGFYRRFFIWSEEDGLNSQNYLIGSDPAPTYGGHSIDNSGRITGWYIDGANYTSFRYHPDFGYTDIVDLPDPEVPTAHKTRLMGTNNNGEAVVDFVLSDNCHLYKFNEPDAWTGLEKFIPNSTEIHMHDINDAGHMVGWYTDADYVVHGYADRSIQTDFDLNVHGHAFNNENDPVWNWDFAAFEQFYANDPYWWGYGYPFPQPEPGFLFFPSSYPSWVDFVQVMSPQSCYYNISFQGYPFDTPVMRPHTFSAWKIHKTDNFEGACFGMACNTGASWQFPELLNSKFNPVGSGPILNEIYNLGSAESLISAANQGMAAQASEAYTGINAGFDDVLPHEVMNALYESMTTGSEVPVIGFNLQLSSGLFGHAVFPYAMIPREGELNIFDLYIYDPNATGDESVAFEVVHYSDQSTYSVSFGAETTPPLSYGMQLMFAQDLYAPTLVPGIVAEEFRMDEDEVAEEIQQRDDEGNCVHLFTLNASSFGIEGLDGSISVNGSEVTNTIDGAKPIFRFGGMPETISQFELPLGEYTLSNSLSAEAAFDGGIIAGETIINYHRYGATEGEADALILNGDALSYVNTSGTSDEVRAEVSTYVDGNEWYFDVEGLELDTDQSVTLQFLEDGLYISNDGTSTAYDVTVNVFDEDEGVFETQVGNIPLGEGITQIIIPDFGEDGLDGITITETDDDPGTEDITFDLPNTGTSLLFLSTDTLLLDNSAQAAAFVAGNFGSGTLEWEVTELPSWVTVNSGGSGVNYGVVSLDVSENLTSERSGLLTVQNTEDASETATVFIQQSDSNDGVDEAIETQTSIYPNPTARRLTVELPSVLKDRTTDWTIYNLTGQQIATGKSQGQMLTLDFEGYAPGVYVLELTSGNLSLQQKFIKINPAP